MQTLGIADLLGVYVSQSEDGEYYFGLASRNRRMHWGSDEIPVVRTMADIITSAINVSDKQASLQRLATTDALTGLVNRRQCHETLGKELSRLRRTGQSAALMMIDLDHFKRINDSLGHAAGDCVLQHFAGIARPLMREVDTVARIGGEEFVILLPDTGIDAARLVAERLRHSIDVSPALFDAREVAITASIGVVAIHAQDDTPDVIFRRADAVLYAAKHGGRNRVCLEGNARNATHPDT